MKYLIFLVLLLSGTVYGQSTYYIRADSIRFQKVPSTSNSTTFILENATRYKTGGYLRNRTDGRTDFYYAIDSASVSGGNLTLWRGGGTQNIVVGFPTTGQRFGVSGEDATAAQTRTFALAGFNYKIENTATGQYFLLQPSVGRMEYYAESNNGQKNVSMDLTPDDGFIQANDSSRVYLAGVGVGGTVDGTGVILSVGDNSNAAFSLVNVKADSIVLKPFQGKLNIDTLRTWVATDIADTLYKKVMTYDIRNGMWQYGNWHGGAAGATPTLQQVITAGATMTGDNTIINGDNTLTLTNNTLGADKGVSITSNSTAAAGNAQQLFSITLSGANATASQATWAAFIRNQHSGTSSQNTALELLSNTGTTNYGLITTASGTGNRAIFSDGNLQFTNLPTATNDTTTYKPLSIDASGNVVPMDGWKGSGGSGTPAGNFGNVQINRNSLFDTPGSDSLDFDGGGLNVKGVYTATSYSQADNFRVKPSYTSDFVATLSYFGNGTNAYGALTLRENSTGGGDMVTIVPHLTSDTYTITLPANDGTSGQYLKTDGSGNTSWDSPSGSGDVTKVGTPANNQVGVWTGDGTIEGSDNLFYDGTALRVGSATAIPANTNLYVRGTGSSAGNTWKGRIVSGGDNVAFLMGEINSQAWIGAHNAALGAWASFYLNPDGGENLYLGNNVGAGQGNPIITINNTTTLVTIEGPLTINEAGANVDFRYESDALSEALKVEGTDGEVRMAFLAGSGSRAVLADAEGDLSAPVSDRSVKENIKKLNVGINDIMKLKPVSFEYKQGYKNYGSGTQMGFIAQDIQRVFPNSVYTNYSNGKMGYNATDLIPVLVKAVQEQQKQINELFQILIQRK